MINFKNGNSMKAIHSSSNTLILKTQTPKNSILIFSTSKIKKIRLKH
jgi:hypothetical protein